MANELQRQRGNLEANIKTLINNDLKEICKAYDYQVSGTKAVLQKRCIEILNDTIARGDLDALHDLQYRLSHHGQTPPRSHTAAGSSNHNQPTNGYSSYNQMGPRGGGANRLPSNRNYFKPSPFYDVQETVLPLTDLPDGPEMPQNRHTVKTLLQLTPDQAARLRSDPTLKLLLYCGATTGMHVGSPVDVAFPNQLEVKINDDDVRANFKGLKNKPGSTKPADITDKVRKNGNYQNRVNITYALTAKRFAFVVHLVKHVPADELAERIKTGKHGGGIITKATVLQEMSRMNDDDDIAATSVRMSLKDPISTLRITLPVRSTVCTHNQCFDGAMFLQLQDQAPQWSCPVCNKTVTYQSLSIDKYFEEILQKTPSSIEKVDIEPDGQWRVIKEEEDSQPKGHSSKGGRASYDDDFDDDLIEIQDTSKPKLSNGVSLLGAPPRFTPAIQSPYPMNTPPLSSRGPSAAPSISSAQTGGTKRPSSSVIDLTLSDDEDDEPPRPAKRQSTMSTQYGNPSNYSSPMSLPDHRYSSQAPPQIRSADSFRPSSTSSRPTANSGQFGTLGTNIQQQQQQQYGGQLATSSASASPAPGPSFPQSFWSVAQQQSAPQHPHSSRPPSTAGVSNTSAFQPFSVRPPPPSASPANPGPPHNGIRLPPIQPHPENGYTAGWRSDYSYSNSPPG